MAEIGATLREARVRARIDISEIEAATKIRPKYLRALENEDWNVLPGGSYTRSFLRAYAEVVGIDPTPLLEELRLHHEPSSEFEYERPMVAEPPRSVGTRPRDDQRRRASRRRDRGSFINRRTVAIAVVLLVLLVAIVGLASSGGDDNPGAASSTPGNTVVELGGTTTTPTTTRTSASPEPVSLQIDPSSAILVCLVDASGERLVDGAVLQPGVDQQTHRSRRFRISLGPGEAKLNVGTRTYNVPAAGAGYVITANGRRKLARADWPNCGV